MGNLTSLPCRDENPMMEARRCHHWERGYPTRFVVRRRRRGGSVAARYAPVEQVAECQGIPHSGGIRIVIEERIHIRAARLLDGKPLRPVREPAGGVIA